jgi:hypothetical protein
MATITITSGQTLSSGDVVTATKLNNLGGPTAALTAGSIVAADLATDSVTTTKILDANVTPAKLSQPLTLRTAQATTSGLNFTFSTIPSWAKRITVMFDSVSTNGASRVQVQLGDAGGVEATGYVSTVVAATEGASPTVAGTSPFATGFPIHYGSDGSARTGALTITSMGGNKWVAQGAFTNNNIATTCQTVGVKTLSDTLTQLLVTTVNGTDTFDAGSVNVMYE